MILSIMFLVNVVIVRLEGLDYLKEEVMYTIKEEDWIWYGNALHFICGEDCLFHLATKVGDHLVSTVGELWPERPIREIYAKCKDKKWYDQNKHLLGDSFDFAYQKKFGFEDVCHNRKFETMVFKIKEIMPCGCPKIEPSELDFDSYNEHEEANKGHLKMCKKWSKKRQKSLCES